MTDITTDTADNFGLPGQTPGSGRAFGLAGLAKKSKSAAPAVTPAAALTLADIPDPDAPTADDAEFTKAERQDFEACERAARSHHASFWHTGKALDAVARRRLYREDYSTFDELLEAWDITLADSSRMRRGWRLADRLLPEVPKLSRSHVEALLPVVEAYDVDAAVTLHRMLREALPRVTASAIKQIVRELPGPDGAGAPADVIRAQAEKALAEPDDDTDGSTDANDPLRRAVSERARQLANDLKRSRIPRQELNRALTEAFADPDDPQVYRALLRWMKARSR
ncbi:hypothetical protein QFZ63_000459 [Streptomyces sp. B3I7]|uniref:hypothetical protein n=1 Tax=Streptomyces sp. B3I7 TaxID=3042269 RepID=UPI002780168D|nr:hypothetical protein [Streptomyces sp. B3I7]MDQ0808745.1 hypothetical protein [Streptomyces sp. B3I7]